MVQIFRQQVSQSFSGNLPTPEMTLVLQLLITQEDVFSVLLFKKFPSIQQVNYWQWMSNDFSQLEIILIISYIFLVASGRGGQVVKAAASQFNLWLMLRPRSESRLGRFIWYTFRIKRNYGLAIDFHGTVIYVQVMAFIGACLCIENKHSFNV